MTKKKVVCLKCGHTAEAFANPLPTVDVIIEMPEERGIILIHRKNEPRMWALPGGFVDYGESVERAAEREAAEETGLAVSGLRLFGVYSDPSRDARGHTISTVFTAVGDGVPAAADDADGIGIFREETLPSDIAFDHRKILADYFSAPR